MRRLADGAGAFCCGRSASKLIGKTAPEHREDGRLFRLQTRKCITQLILYLGLDLEQQIPIKPTFIGRRLKGICPPLGARALSGAYESRTR
jgi:hypothetical protein